MLVLTSTSLSKPKQKSPRKKKSPAKKAIKKSEQKSDELTTDDSDQCSKEDKTIKKVTSVIFLLWTFLSYCHIIGKVIFSFYKFNTCINTHGVQILSVHVIFLSLLNKIVFNWIIDLTLFLDNKETCCKKKSSSEARPQNQESWQQ